MLFRSLTWLLGYRLGLGAFGGWLGLCAEIVCGAGLLWWRLERKGWLPAAAEGRARLAADATAAELAPDGLDEALPST